MVALLIFLWGNSLWSQEALPPELAPLIDRLNATEQSIQDVRDENQSLRLQLDQVLQSRGDLYPLAQKVEEDSRMEDGAPQEAVKLNWFDKINLRGYAQFRYNTLTRIEPGSTRPTHPGDSSISDDQEFLIRRARLVLFGEISDHLAIYMQPDFASTPNGALDSNQFAQIRDWYGDIFLDETQVHRFRVGQSKIPYGWENLQSSQNRLSLDRNDAFNSAARNERDLGIFYYWTPEWAQDTFKFIADEGLKGSGNYGVFGFGAYNGQGGSLREFNDELHLISRLTLPLTMDNGQIVEFGIQGYTGRYVVLGSAIAPLGVGPAVIPLGTRGQPYGQDGQLDQRLGWSFNYYPQPFGLQAEYTIGRGPELNAAQTAVERGSLHGGYVMANARWETEGWGELWPYARWQYYRGGYRSAPNAPAATINEWNFGVEWQMRKELELVCEYLITDRTNLNAQSTGESYEQFEGQILRFQLQLNF